MEGSDIVVLLKWNHKLGYWSFPDLEMPIAVVIHFSILIDISEMKQLLVVQPIKVL